MKTMSKILALVLTLTMVLSLGIGAFAEAGLTATKTGDKVTISVASTDNHKYKIYQIFTGTVDGGELTDIKWGADSTEYIDEENPVAVGNGTLVELTALEEASTDDIIAKVSSYLASTAEGRGVVTKDAPLENLPAGYYMIVDCGTQEDGSIGEGESYSKTIINIVPVTESMTINRKAGQPTVTKKVKDINDFTGVPSDWQDSADHDIGDAIEFQLRAKIGDYYGLYQKYYLSFEDTMSTGLTFNRSSVHVNISGVDVTDCFSVLEKTDEKTGENIISIVCGDLKNITNVGIQSGTVIEVTYTATLNKNAVIGADGNPNKVYLKYSSNPNDDTGGELGQTPEDKVIVFTYETKIDKVDPAGAPLPGAKFELYAVYLEGKVPAGETGVTSVKYQNNNKTYNVQEGYVLVKLTDYLLEEGQTSFGFKGLDDGKYILFETMVPGMYNGIAPIKFEITAKHGQDGEPNALQLTELKAETSDDSPYKGATFASTLSSGIVSTEVMNVAGTFLPSTGGIGTTLFYVVGSVLMLAAVVLLITRKKMAAYQD